MKHALEVCLIALTLNAPMVVAQSETTPPLKPGISVQMVVAGNATPMAAADEDDALVVTVTDNGEVYAGIDLTPPAALPDKIKNDLSSQRQRLYIKADARTPYANVVRVLEAAHSAGVAEPVLLTTQPEPAAPGTIASPKGLEVYVGSATSNSSAIVVQMFAGPQEPTLALNHQPVASDRLQSTLRRLLQGRNDKVVL
jgi:biopolymer transport protein ExbD